MRRTQAPKIVRGRRYSFNARTRAYWKGAKAAAREMRAADIRLWGDEEYDFAGRVHIACVLELRRLRALSRAGFRSRTARRRTCGFSWFLV